MRDDRPSTTAAYVAMGRALATRYGQLDDPFAFDLLPDDMQAAVTGLAAKRWPRSARAAALQGIAFTTSRMMGPRTRSIDDALTELPQGFQLVVLGAGLDARAHRLPLERSVVFEVDHPQSQRFKRDRVGALPVRAREVRYVAVDFARDGLEGALEAAGHLPHERTAWVWEGVVTYLTRAQIEATLAVVQRRSAPGSRLVLTYNEQSLLRRLTAAVTGRAGEPHRTWWTRSEARALLAEHGFAVTRDLGGLERATRYGLSLGPVERAWVWAHHVLVADYEPVTAP